MRHGHTQFASDLRKKGKRIAKGPLKGCYRHPSGMTCKIGRGFVMLFKPVIRVGIK